MAGEDVSHPSRFLNIPQYTVVHLLLAGIRMRALLSAERLWAVVDPDSRAGKERQSRRPYHLARLEGFQQTAAV